MSEPIRLAIVDDDPLVRAGLALMLGGQDDVLIVAEAADGDEVAAMVAAHRPDVVLMDLRMPRVDGLRATERLLSGPQPPQVVVLTTFDSDEHVLRALRAGAAGFLLKDTAPTQILDAVRRVDPARNHRREQARARLAELTDRELEVAHALSQGQSNAELAGTLHLSTGTVKAYISRLLTKLDLTNRVQIALLVHDAELN